jgi:hypothetical protein
MGVVDDVRLGRQSPEGTATLTYLNGRRSEDGPATISPVTSRQE